MKSLPRRVRLHPRAGRDVRRAVAWYDKQSTGLGDRFVAAVREAIRKIETTGDVLPFAYRDFRRMWVTRFPYGVFFRVTDDEFIVMAVLHNRQSLTRLSSR